MSTSMPTTAWGSIAKAVELTAHSKHKHGPNPISPDFEPPQATSRLKFSPTALAAAIARTATTRNAPAALLIGLQNSVLPLLECLVADGPAFELSTNFNYLADTERTSLAARIGAGITDLYMNSLGYTWRANAACLSKLLDPHADFIYHGGNAARHGVVLAEARGSFAANVDAKSIARQATTKYMRQVKPYLAGPSPYGKVIHGYSVAFGSQPGSSGAYLGLAETKIPPKSKTPPVATTQSLPNQSGTPTSIVLATHRSNFLLLGMLDVVDWIDWALGVGVRPEHREPISLIRLRYAGRHYLASAYPTSLVPFRWWLEEFWHPAWWRLRTLHSSAPRPVTGSPALGWFVLEETACQVFLNALAAIIRADGEERPEQLELPNFEPVGFGVEDADSTARDQRRPDYNYALFRDGLALLETPAGDPRPEIRLWSPAEGLYLD